ncbi:MAG: NAD(P)-dependent oxidoreductase [Alphaproteobacteria bacterium]|nr:NAD(P)-dependent oxidoreductase [Alphaproteobacteria bacterium]
MSLSVAIIGAGEMGAAVGRRLRESGAAVATSLAGRSTASRARVEAAGIAAVDGIDALISGADIVLSIVPPGQARGVAAQVAGVLAAAARRPAFVDCNAIAPATMRAIAATLAGSAGPVIDAGIIGAPPAPDRSGPVFYVSGPADARVDALASFGLDVARLDGPVGTASALKLSYAGMTKGLTALCATMALGAVEGGVAEALRTELARSQPMLAAWLHGQVPRMYPKAYRWVAEMEEIAAFLGHDPGGQATYRGIARTYEQFAAARDGNGPAIAKLQDILKPPG